VSSIDVEPRRCTAADVAQVLQVVPDEPWEIILSQPWGATTISFDWHRSTFLLQQQNSEWVVIHAQLPGVHGFETWDRGCERTWDPAADELICPLRLLTERSRGRLLDALAAADCWPEPDVYWLSLSAADPEPAERERLPARKGRR
jgi:hypothetical protein